MFNNAFLKTLKILYIETEESTNKHFFNILQKMFKEVISFTKAKDAIEYINKSDKIQEDIVICDLFLDNSFGTEILELIKEKDELTPFILTANDINIDEVIKAIKLKVQDFLLKPVNAKDLVLTVEKICNDTFSEKLNLQTAKDLKEIESLIDEVALVSKTNKKGEITFVNSYFTKTTKFESDEAINKSHEIIKSSTIGLSKYDEINEALKNHEKWEGKLKEESKENKEFYSYLTILPMDNDEFLWVRFLATDYEEEQNDFKKKVKKNIKENKRINNDARDRIDELQNRILYYQSLDGSLKHERQREQKFTKQISYYTGEIVELEDKLEKVSKKATSKIKTVVALEKTTRMKRDKTVSTLEDLTINLDIKNKTIKELTKELDKQKKIIKDLKLKIDNREYKLGLND